MLESDTHRHQQL